MSEIESAWPRYPGYAIDLVPWAGRARVRRGEVVLAETDAAVIVQESDHQDQLYIPEGDVRWEHFTPSDTHTVCPFKGEADYWTLSLDDTTEPDAVWTYRDPFPEVEGLAGLVAFYTDRVEVELLDSWPDADDVPYRFPVWGSAETLADLIDVAPAEEGVFSSSPYPDPPLGTFLDIPADRRPRLVVEGGHLLGQAIVAASRCVPNQRVVTATMNFSRAAMFDAPLELAVDVLRGGRTYSTVETRTRQHDRLCATGLVLLDAGADDVYRHAAQIPDVAGPDDCPHHDWGVTGRDVRVVDGAYDNDPDAVGPPVLRAWTRFRTAPDDPALHRALLAQSITHYTIAASMRPHRGVTEAMAHVTLSTGPMSVQIAFHDEPDVTAWHLYDNPAVYAGRGHVQGQGRIFTREGGLVATYSVHAMVRALTADPAKVGGYATAM